MPIKPVERWSKKYEDRATIATDDYRWGIENPARSPTESAIAMKETLMKKMAAKETWDKWEEARRFVGDEGWRKGAIEKGVDRYAPGIRVGLDKYTDFATKFRDHMERKVEEVHKMPKVTLDDSIKRCIEMIKHNAKFRYKKR
jgi:hypothetical protein